jgi:hypothetical protein
MAVMDLDREAGARATDKYVPDEESIRYVVGVDLGQSADPTAIAVLQHSKAYQQPSVERIDCKHLERLPLGTSYPNVVRHVRDLLARPPLCSDQNLRGKWRPGCRPAELVIDETGVGRAVGDIFDGDPAPIRVTITSGSETTWQGGTRWHVAKTALISKVDALLHTGVLRFAAGLTDAQAMKDELLDFRRKLSDAGRATYGARVGRHDDLVLAVAVGCWWLTMPPPPRIQLGGY